MTSSHLMVCMSSHGKAVELVKHLGPSLVLQCSRSHPYLRSRPMATADKWWQQRCRDGINCANYKTMNCPFQHPVKEEHEALAGTQPQSRDPPKWWYKKCRYGVNCQRYMERPRLCWFQHELLDFPMVAITEASDIGRQTEETYGWRCQQCLHD